VAPACVADTELSWCWPSWMQVWSLCRLHSTLSCVKVIFHHVCLPEGSNSAALPPAGSCIGRIRHVTPCPVHHCTCKQVCCTQTILSVANSVRLGSLMASCERPLGDKHNVLMIITTFEQVY
jgi:hypothetical protein